MAVYSMTADGGSGSALKSNTLLVNTEVYKTKQKRMLEAEDKLVLNNSAFGMENEVCGTQSVDMLADYWHKTEKTDIRFHDFACNELDALMTRILASVNEASDKTADALELEKSKDKTEVSSDGSLGNLLKNSKPGVIAKKTEDEEDEENDNKPFDDEGEYGGNQRSVDKGFKIGPFVFFENEDLYDYIRKQPGYENYTDAQIYALLKQLKNEGCSYVADINAIFNSYIGREDDFLADFGFPMYDEKGELNYEMLLVDFYLSTRDIVYLDGYDGYRAYMNSMMSYYKNHPDEYKNKYGTDFLDSEGNITESGYANLDKEYHDYIEAGVTEVTINGEGYSAYGVGNKLEHYAAEHGCETDIVDMGDTPTDDEIKKMIEQGYTVVFYAREFELEKEDGSPYHDGQIIGPHEMTITGITEDGRYIVSTWGKKLYLDPDDIDSEDFSYGFFYAMKVEQKEEQ